MSNYKKIEYIVFGVIMLGLGIIFLISNFYPDLHIWETIVKLWPLLLIFYGIKILYLAISKRSKTA